MLVEHTPTSVRNIITKLTLQDSTMTSHTIKVSLASIGKSIDHSLLHPSMSDAAIDEGISLCRTLATGQY
jgi:hypothetical protein